MAFPPEGGLVGLGTEANVLLFTAGFEGGVAVFLTSCAGLRRLSGSTPRSSLNE